MQPLFFSLCLFLATSTAVSTSQSVTLIQPNEQFVVGNNEHKGFKVSMRNGAPYSLSVYKRNLTNVATKPTQVTANEVAEFSMSANQALVIQNKGNRTVRVYLKLSGDPGLAMGYTPVSN